MNLEKRADLAMGALAVAAGVAALAWLLTTRGPEFRFALLVCSATALGSIFAFVLLTNAEDDPAERGATLRFAGARASGVFVTGALSSLIFPVSLAMVLRALGHFTGLYPFGAM